MVYGVESVVVGQCDVRIVFEQQTQHVIPSLADRIVQRGVAFGVLVVRIIELVRESCALCIETSAR